MARDKASAAKTPEASGRGGMKPTSVGKGLEERPRRRPGRPAGRALEGALETRDQVLAHARRLFVQRGYADVSVGEVANAVGVTKPTLYYHFSSKEGLYAATLNSLMRVVGGHIRRVVESVRPLRERLNELAFRYFLVADAPMEPLLRDTSELIGARRAEEVWMTYEQEVVAPLRGLMHEAIEGGEMWAGEPDIFVRAFLGLLDGLTAPGGHKARSEVEHQRMASVLTAIFLDGTAPRT